MSTITLPNIRVSSDLTVSVRLKDNGVAIDWSTLNNVKASIYSDAQRALAGRCDVSVDAEDPTVLVCQYAANKPQYVGVCRIVVSAKYMGETKTYDKPAFNFVRWTADQDGEQITIDDPDVDVEIDVADVSSSLLDEAIRAAFTAAEEAVDAKGQVLETEAEVEAAEALRVSAEESRVEAEEGRAEAEAARVDEEAVRVSAEDARVVAENARAAAEDLREGAEDDRAAAETARETAEVARVAAEALRVTAEGSRETAEAAREAQASADHTVAAGDHTQAAADHTQAAADHTTAASDHTQAGADHTLAAADHVTAGEDHAQAQDDHEVMAGYDTRLGNVEGEVSQLEAKVTDIEVDDTSTEDNEIVIETDGGTQVAKIDENGLEVTNFVANGVTSDSVTSGSVTTEQMTAENAETKELSVLDINGKDILGVSESPTEEDTEEIVISSGNDVVAKISPDGVRANRLFLLSNTKEREILAPPTNMKYAEIGDSITYLADNKYETSYDDSGTTLTGYKGWGYGRYLCKYLGIPYENHYPQGANGRGFSTYCKEWIVDGHWSFPDNINVWTIFLGTNDWGLARTPLGTKDDYIGDTWTVSNQTTYGAIRKIVDKIRSQNTNADPPQIIFITPLQRGAFLYGATAEQAESVFVKSAITINADGEYEYTQNANGDTLKDVVDAIKWVCEYESFKCVDWFNESIFDKASLNMAQEFSDAGWDASHIFGTVEIDGMRDNLHPLPGGKIYKLMGARLANEIADRFQDSYFD